MPDGNILIAERLGKFALAQEIDDEVIAELHLTWKNPLTSLAPASRRNRRP